MIFFTLLMLLTNQDSLSRNISRMKWWMPLVFEGEIHSKEERYWRMFLGIVRYPQESPNISEIAGHGF